MELKEANFSNAIIFLKESIRYSSNDYLIHYQLGAAYLQTLNYTKAVKSLEQSIQLNSTNLDSLILLSVAYVNLTNYDKAIVPLEQLLKIKSNSIPANANLGELYAIQKKNTLAIEKLSNAVKNYECNTNKFKYVEHYNRSLYLLDLLKNRIQ